RRAMGRWAPTASGVGSSTPRRRDDALAGASAVGVDAARPAGLRKSCDLSKMRWGPRSRGGSLRHSARAEGLTTAPPEPTLYGCGPPAASLKTGADQVSTWGGTFVCVSAVPARLKNGTY